MTPRESYQLTYEVEKLIEDPKAAVVQAERSSALRALLVRADGSVFSAVAHVEPFAGQGAGETGSLIEWDAAPHGGS